MKRTNLALAALTFAVTVGCHGRTQEGGALRRDVGLRGSGPIAVEIDLSRGASEEADTGTGIFSRPSPRTYAALIESIAQVKARDNVKAVFVRLGDTHFDWARSEELGRLFQRLRSEQRTVICHAHSYSNSSLLFVARACDKVWLSPAGDVDAVGIGGQVVYLKNLLDRFKVHADFLHVGKYKSAAETLTNSGPSDEARESLLSVLGSIRQTWLDGVTQSRKGDQVQHALEHGPWDAEAAKQHGLIDEVGYESEAATEARSHADGKELETVYGLMRRQDAANEIAELIRRIAGASPAEGREPRIALVAAVGAITMETGGVFSDSGIAYRPLAKTIRRLANDDSVKAVVLRISSPGGSALASDLLWHELTELRKKKPVIASVGEMAASGGYYLASAAQQIFAERSSIVGSIGVVGGKLVFGETLQDFGVNGVTFAASDEPGAETRAAYMSALTPWDDATRERVQAQMNRVYALFLSRVAVGRGLSVEAVDKIGQGRIWSGVQGHENKLVDDLGGLDDAIEKARVLTGLGKDASVDLEGAGETWLDLLSLDERADEAQIRAAFARLAGQPPPLVQKLAAPARPFVAMLQPMLDGEQALAIMPNGVEIY